MAHAPAGTWSNPGDAPSGRGPGRAWKAVGLLAGLAACVGAITYVVLWLTPPTAPRLIVATAAYDDNPLVPSNGTTDADGPKLSELGKPGRARLRPDQTPHRLSRGEAGRVLDELSRSRNPVVVAVFAANGGRDAAGPFLLPDDAGPEPNERIRVKAIIDAAAKLPADTRKLLVFDAAGDASAPVFGQFHNDFARGVRSLDADIAAVPNLLVVVSAGPDQRAWRSPEWGGSVFLHHLRTGLAGAADGNSDSRLSAEELIGYVTHNTRRWAFDQRAAIQVPEVFPSSDAGRRAEAMSLGVVDRYADADPLPADFTPPPAWDAMWAGFAELDESRPHPTAFAPQLWNEYVGWVLRSDRLLADGCDVPAEKARDRAEQTRLKIVSARPLAVSPQTLALPGSFGQPEANSATLGPVIGEVALASDADRPAEWEKAKQQADRLALGRALVHWVADDPFARLRFAPPVVALIADGFAVAPAELHFLLMVARDLPNHPATARVWPLLQRVLRLRLLAERTATSKQGEEVRPWVAGLVETADTARRLAEDLVFADGDANWRTAHAFAASAEWLYAAAGDTADSVRFARTTYQTAGPKLCGLTEWLAAGDHPTGLLGRMTREEWLAFEWATWGEVHKLGEACDGPPSATRAGGLKTQARILADRVKAVDDRHRAAVARLLDPKHRDDSRAGLVRWWAAADKALSAPFTARRRDLLVEHRRVSRQLNVLARNTPTPLAEPNADDVREQAFASARRRGLLQLAAVGKGACGEDFDRVTFQIDQSTRQADAPAELVAGGELFATAVRRLPGTIPDGDDTLPEADRLARCSLLPVANDPAVRLRKRRAGELLNWQADRTLADRWSGVGPAKPYFAAAVETLAADSRALTGRVIAPPPTLPFPLKTRPPEEVVVTDEPNPRATFTIAADSEKRLPAVGFVAYQSANSRFTRFSLWGFGHTSLPIPPRTAPLPTQPVVERSTVELTGYFRGRRDLVLTAVARYPVPNSTAVRQPTDNRVSVAVRPSDDIRARFGRGSGHLHFVIDCSGSMGQPDNPAAQPQFAAACNKLEEVLAAVPPGVTLAVSAFGQKTPAAKTPEEAFATLREPAEWTTDELAAVMKQVRAQQPWDKSAVVNSVLRARATVGKTTAARAVILFSDCADNRFTDPETNPKKVSVKEALRANFDGGCPLHVVAFPAEPAADGVREEFRSVTTFKPAGLFLTPAETDKLINWIRTATAPQVRLTLAGDRQTDDLTAGTDATDNWLSPMPTDGRFTLALSGEKPPQTLDLQPGERLLLTLLPDKTGVKFARPNFAAEVPAVGREPAGGWTVAVPRQRLNTDGGLEMVALTDRGSPGAAVMSPARVGDVWFELTSSANRPVAVTWTNTTGWPCPAWDVRVPKWPTDAGKPSVPTLSAWWSESAFPASATWTMPTDTPLSAVEPFRVGEATVTGLSVEEHDGRTCLVVRLIHQEGRPVTPRPTTVPAGSEVRIFTAANRVTALFWWDDTRAAVNTLRGLEFVSLGDVKAKAVSARLPALPPPAPGTPAPTPAPR